MQSAEKIDGVKIIGLESHVDERGYFMEVYRKSLLKNVPVRQVSVSLTNPGIIKAFHWHRRQFDVWHIVSGKALVVLHDMRENSPTAGCTQSFVADDLNPILVVIPKMVAHGYKVLGDKPLLMLYLMDKEYDRKNPDEGRIEFDDKSIGFDWHSEG